MVSIAHDGSLELWTNWLDRDQELRFTVHESPDYFNIKISIFNDDKKTELIGEAWVNLDDVILPGGGQRDLWQNLSCRGKYAGEVRLEITYYDTRPRPEKPKEPVLPEQHVEEPRDRTSASAPGSRHETPIKRRPLPSNPGSASHSPNVDTDYGRQLPGPRGYHGPTDPRTERYDNAPSDYNGGTIRRKPAPHMDQVDSSPGHSLPRSRSPQPFLEDEYHEPPRDLRQNSHYSSQEGHGPYYTQQYANQPHHHEYAEPSEYDSYRQPHYPVQDDVPRRLSQQPQGNAPPPFNSHREPGRGQYDRYSNEYRNGEPQYPPEQPPPTSHYPPQPYVEDAEGYGGTDQYSPPEPDHRQFHEPMRRSSMNPVEHEDDIPPPPPVHRSTPSSQISAPQPMDRHSSYTPVSPPTDAPAPLRISLRGNQGQPVSPYSEPDPSVGMGVVRYNERAAQQRMTASPQPMDSFQEDFSARDPMDLGRRPSGADFSDQSQMIQTSPRPDSAGRPPSYHSDAYAPSPTAHRPTYPGTSPQQPLPHYGSNGPSPFHSPPQPSYKPRTNSVPNFRGDEADDTRHAMTPYDTPPLIKPLAVSPTTPHSAASGRPTPPTNRSTPNRRPVSPLPPQSADFNGSSGGIPFSPDSYEAFNPHSRFASASNQSTPNDTFRNSYNGPSPYDTPSKSRKAGTGPTALEPRPSPLSSSQTVYDTTEPIIDAHGRTVDPSDHLPVSAWAPEPERKSPIKERPVRERERLTGAREPGSRPRMGSTATSSTGTVQSLVVASRPPLNSAAGADVVVLPSSLTGRNRLQKRARPQSAMVVAGGQAHSVETSPVPVPPGYGRPMNGHRSADASPVAGRYDSPGQRGSYGGAPPPIPAKVPLDADGEENMSALSMEMSRIDIGTVGSRTRGGRRIGVSGY